MTARELEKIAAEQGARVVVPSEPDEKMREAGLIAGIRGVWDGPDDTPMLTVQRDVVLAIYKAMISARPTCAEDVRTAAQLGWQCPKCGRGNAPWVASCVCGPTIKSWPSTGTFVGYERGAK